MIGAERCGEISWSTNGRNLPVGGIPPPIHRCHFVLKDFFFRLPLLLLCCMYVFVKKCVFHLPSRYVVNRSFYPSNIQPCRFVILRTYLEGWIQAPWSKSRQRYTKLHCKELLYAGCSYYMYAHDTPGIPSVLLVTAASCLGFRGAFTAL